MQAVIFDPPFIGLRDVPEPALPGREWLKVRVLSAGICGSDVSKIARREYGSGYLQTRILGHEICGAVAECGFAGGGLRSGDLVAVEPLLPCGSCERCEIGCTQLCPSLKVLGRNLDGGFAEFICAHRSQVHRLESSTGPLDAVLADPLATVLHAFNSVEAMHKRTIAIIGDGAIGLLCCTVARWAGFHSITLIAKHRHIRDIAADFGVTEFLLWDELDCKSLPDTADVVMETVGGRQSETLRLSIAIARPGGTVAVLGVYPPNFDGLLPVRAAFAKELRFVGINSYSANRTACDFAMALHLIQQGVVKPKRLITHALPLSQMENALYLLQNRRNSKAIKVVLNPQ